MLAPASEVTRTTPNTLSEQPLAGTTTLFRTGRESLAWGVAEQRDDDWVYWGNCSDTFTQPASFDCLRTLTIEDLGLTYTVARDNLELYPDLDDLLTEKVNEWRCDSGKILIER